MLPFSTFCSPNPTKDLKRQIDGCFLRVNLGAGKVPEKTNKYPPSLPLESMRRTDLLYCPQLRCRPARGINTE